MATIELESIEQQSAATYQHVEQQIPFITDFEQGTDELISRIWDKECQNIYINNAIPAVKRALIPYLLVLPKILLTQKQINYLKRDYYHIDLAQFLWYTPRVAPLINVFTCQQGLEELPHETSVNMGGGQFSFSKIVGHLLSAANVIHQVTQLAQHIPI